VSQSGLELAILLSQHPKCRDYRHTPPFLTRKHSLHEPSAAHFQLRKGQKERLEWGKRQKIGKE
jgi:hypothetical protein